MARRKLHKRNIRKLTKSSGGDSYGIILPIEFVRKLRWRAKQKLRVTLDKRRKTIRIKDWSASPKRKRGKEK